MGDAVQDITAVQEITDLLYRYAELFDTGRFDEFAALFEHGTWHKAEPGAAGARRWIEDNVLLYDGLTRTKHVTTNVSVAVDEEAGTATARAYVTIFQALPDFPLQPIYTGTYRDRLTRRDGVWEFTERRATGDLYGDMSRHVRSARPAGPA
ncbi:nuclear transport factor 2 family protein [Blastococcus sp. SYSU D00820]